MSILFQEPKPPPSQHRSRRILIIAGVLLILMIALFNDVLRPIPAFVIHFVTPPAHFTYKGHNDYVSSVAWSPDGKYIASGSGDNTVRVWNATTGTTMTTYRGHTNAVFSVAWSPNGQYLASGGIDSTVQVWKATTGEAVYTYRGHTDAVFSIAWSHDSKYLATASNDGSIRIWAFPSGKERSAFVNTKLHGRRAPWDAIAWSPDDRFVASGGVGAMPVLDVNTGQPVAYYGFPGDNVHSVSWSPDGTNITFGNDNGTIEVWNIARHSNIYNYAGHNTNVNSVAWSPSGKRIASSTSDGLIEVWDALTGGHVYTYRGHSDFYLGHFTSDTGGEVEFVAWSPDSKRIASASTDNTVQVWTAQ